MTRAVLVVATLLVAAACREPADAERVGDRAYAARDFGAAYQGYAAAADARDDAALLAKLGLAALRQGDAPGAIAAYGRLAEADPGRVLDAAEGLAAAARVAASARSPDVLEAAMTALQEISPDRPVGPWVIELGRQRALNDAQLVRLAPAGIAAARDPGTGDSLLVAWADALVRGADCDGAGSLYRAAARRTADAELGATARAGASACALAAARQALGAADTAGALDALGSVQPWADADSGAAEAAALAAEIRAAAARLAPMDTTFFMDDR